MVVDFPLLEWDEESNRYHAMHHPFTAPKMKNRKYLKANQAKLRPMHMTIINGNEIGGGSVKFDKKLQETMFNLLGFSEADAKKQFGFLMDALNMGHLLTQGLHLVLIDYVQF